MEFEGVELVELPPYDGVYAGVVPLGVDLAKRLLKRNTNNRDMRELKVLDLMRTMTADQWQLNGEAIKIDRLGVMSDGQHRCEAVVALDDDNCYPTILVYGLEPEAQETMDQGTKRLAYEQLKIAGIEASPSIAAAVRMMIRWDDGLLFRDDKLRATTTDIVAWAKANPDAMEWFRIYSDRGYKRIIGCPPSISLAVAYKLRAIDEKTMTEFFDSLLEPVGLEAGSPILALRSRLERILSTREKVVDRDMIAYFLSAWNALRDGRPMGKVLGPRGGKWTEATFPVPR